jgi:hypothetical protein
VIANRSHSRTAGAFLKTESTTWLVLARERMARSISASAVNACDCRVNRAVVQLMSLAAPATADAARGREPRAARATKARSNFLPVESTRPEGSAPSAAPGEQCIEAACAGLS